MTNEELESLKSDIDALRKAVRKANPFLRSIMTIRRYASWSIPLGLIILAYCIASHLLVRSFGSLQALPSWWATGSWIALALFLLVSGIAKWAIIGKRAAETEEGATYATAIKAVYSGGWININLPISLCILVIVAFAIWVGHPWYIVPGLSICLGLSCNALAFTADTREYLATGWYALATGFASLFFIEAAPFIWTAIVWAGVFLVYGISGLVASPREEGGK